MAITKDVSWLDLSLVDGSPFRDRHRKAHWPDANCSRGKVSDVSSSHSFLMQSTKTRMVHSLIIGASVLLAQMFASILTRSTASLPLKPGCFCADELANCVSGAYWVAVEVTIILDPFIINLHGWNHDRTKYRTSH